MTAISQIITDAYQSNNLIAINAIPSAEEQSKGLRYFNRIWDSLFGHEIGEALVPLSFGRFNTIDVDYQEDYLEEYYPVIIPRNTRLMVNQGAASSVFLPTNPRDGDRVSVQDMSGNFSTAPLTLKANGRKIENVSDLTLNANNFSGEWFYRADLGNWVRVSSLELQDEFPLPRAFEEFFITMLALRLNPSEGVMLDEQFKAVMQMASTRLRTRYRHSTEVLPELGLIRLPSEYTYFV